MERKLAAIFSADVQGYSRLMGQDEEATVHTLKAYREVMTHLIQHYRGRVVDSPGDNLLAEFGSVVDAVQCATAIQQELARRNAAVPEARQMRLRMGINLGDVLVDGERIYGDGVNIAARVESLADAGGICISGTVYDQVDNKVALTFEYIGEQTVKNIARPIRVYRVVLEGAAGRQTQTAPGADQAQGRRGSQARRGQAPMPVERHGGEQRHRLGVKVAVAVAVVLVVGGLAWHGLPRWGPFRGDQRGALNPHRIAVLPFVNMSGDAENEYFSDGMTEELIASLSQIKGLEVIARTSVMTYKGKAKTIDEIGRELQVGTVLEGSVRKAAHQVRVSAQLIKVQDQGHLWSQHYDRELQGVFAIQSDIAQKVAEALKGKLLAEEKQQIEKKGTDNLEAYNLYLKGLYFRNRQTKEGFEKSKVYFEQAIEKDPNYALAYVGLADFYNYIPWFSNMPPKEAYPKAIAAAEKALKIDNTLAEAYSSLADAKLMYEWDWAGGENAIKQAIQLNPNYALAHVVYNHHYLAPMLRFDEALAEIKRAQELDPLSLSVNEHFEFTLLDTKQYDQVIELSQKTLEIDPNLYYSCIALGEAYLLKGMYEKAILWHQKAVDVTKGLSTAVAFLGWAYGMVGKKDEAQRLLEELKERAKQEHIRPIAFALVYMGLGEKDQAFEWLQKAYEERSPELIHLRSWQIFSIPLGSDPRYRELVKKVGLPME